MNKANESKQTQKTSKPLTKDSNVTLFNKEVYTMPKNIEFNKRGFTVQETQTTIESLSKQHRDKLFHKNISKAGTSFLPLRFHRALDAIALILKWKKFYSLPFEEKYLLNFTEEEFLRAYGVIKSRSKRNKQEFSSRERQEAITVLRELDVTDVLIQVKSKTGDGHKVKSLVDTLIKYEETTEFTDKKQKLGSYITIRLNPFVWIDSHPLHYISKPTNLQAILKDIPKKDRKLFDLFVSIVLCDHPKYPRHRKSLQSRGLHVKKSLEGWALRLNLESYIVNRKNNEIKERLSQMARYGLKHGFLQLAEWTSDGKSEFLKVSMDKQKDRPDG